MKSSEPDYIVIRDIGEPLINGRWYDLEKIRNDVETIHPWETTNAFVQVYYTPTPFIEVRKDGAVAQVWMRKKG